MAQMFLYRARDHGGTVFTGEIVADNQVAVANFIKKKGYFVTGITLKKEPLKLEIFFDRFKPLTTKDLAVFCRQFSTMIDAGVSLLTTLQILIDQTDPLRLKKALRAIYKDVQEGKTLSHSFSQYPLIFPEVMVAMVEAGELGGVLDQVMDRLAVQFEKEYKLKEKVKSVLVYPVVVMSMATFSLTFILIFVLPTFVKIFEDMHTELPFLTKMLLIISAFLQTYGICLAAVLLVAFLLGNYLLSLPEVKLIFDRVILDFPVFGSLWRKIAIARFSRTLGTLVKGGVPLISALGVVKKTSGNRSIAEAIGQAQTSVKEGQGLAKPLKDSCVATAMAVQMVAIGEETGELERMLVKIADFYDSDIEDMVARLNALLEPFLITFMGIVIGLIAIAIMIPIFDVISGMNRI